MHTIVKKNDLTKIPDIDRIDIIWGVAIVPEYKIGFWEGNLWEGECTVIPNDEPLLCIEKKGFHD